MSSNLRFSLIPSAILLFIIGLGIGQSVEAAYTYQKLNELMPELRQFLGRTHLGTLRPLSGQQRGGGQFSSFMDDGQFQASKRMARTAFRERKSNNLRNLMRIGKRRMPTNNALMMGQNVEESIAGGPQNGGMGGAVYYFSPNFPNDNQFQAYRPQSVWL